MSVVKEMSITSKKPNFTAYKWNSSVNYLNILENILIELFGKNTFKGIYNNSKKYKKGDYFWLGEHCCFVCPENENYENMVASGFKNVFLYDGVRYGVNNQRAFYANDEKISVDFDLIYKDVETNDVILTNGSKIIIYDTYKKEQKIFTNLESRVLQIVADRFFIYYIRENDSHIYRMKRFDNTNIKEPFFDISSVKQLSITGNSLFILQNNGNLIIVDTVSKKKIKEESLTKYISNVSKICFCTSPNSFYLFDGANSIKTFFYDENFSIEEDDILKSPATNINTKSLQRSEDKIIINDGEKIDVFYDCRKSVKYIDLKTLKHDAALLVNDNVLDKIEYKNGIFEGSHFKLKNETFKIDENKGLNPFAKMTYLSENSFTNSTIMLKCSEFSNLTFEVQNSDKKQYVFSISEPTSFIFLDIADEQITVISKYEEKIVKNYNFNTASYSFSFIGNAIIDELIFFKKILTDTEKKIAQNNFLFSSFIPSTNKKYPFAKVKTDKDGVIPIQLSNNSLIRDTNGYLVNVISDYSNLKTDNDHLAFSVDGAKKMYSSLKKDLDTLHSKCSPNGHKHKWSDLLSPPKATTGQYGITQLITSLKSESENHAITAKTAKLLNEKIDTLEKVITGNDTNSGNRFTDLIKKLELEAQNRKNLESSLDSRIKNAIADANRDKKDFLNIHKGGTVEKATSITNISFSKNKIEVSKNNTESFVMNFDKLNKNYYFEAVGGIGNSFLNFSIGNAALDQGASFQFGYTNVSGFTPTITFSNAGDISNRHTITKGNINVGGNISLKGDLWVTSDRNLKTEITPINHAKEKMQKLTGYSFYKKGFSKKTSGVIAQELKEVFPEAVQLRKDKFLEVDYNGIHALHIECFKKVFEELEEIREDIRKIKGDK